MFKDFSITTKFFIIGSVIFIILSIFLAIFVNDIIHKLLINRAKTFIADFVKLQAKDHLTPENFDGEENYSLFDNFSKEIKTDEVLRVKIWDNKGTVIYSDDKLIIGKKFTDNEEYNKAILGNIEAEIKKPLKSENEDEREYEELLELYIPILFFEDTPPAVNGVIEIYYKLDNVNKLIKEARIKVFSAAIVSIFFLFFLLWISVKFFVKDPLIKLKGAASEMTKGNFDKIAEVKTKDEIGALAESFNELVIKLKLKQGEIKKVNSELEQKIKEKIGPYDSKIKELEEKIADLESIRNNLEEKLKKFM